MFTQLPNPIALALHLHLRTDGLQEGGGVGVEGQLGSAEREDKAAHDGIRGPASLKLLKALGQEAAKTERLERENRALRAQLEALQSRSEGPHSRA